MSSVDIYDESENLISSDEYSEDDDLMNTAISSQNQTPIEKFDCIPVAKLISNLQEKSKLNQINLLIKRKKFASSYKNRSIKWLNNKYKRQKYKNFLSNVVRKNTNESTETDIKENDIEILSLTVEKNENKVIQLLDFKKESQCQANLLSSKELSNNEAITTKAMHGESPKINVNNREYAIIKDPNSNKRKDCPKIKNSEVEKLEAPKEECSSLYQQINKMFPKYEEIVGNHLKSTITIDTIEQNMTRILQDIQSITDILQTKEIEWNRLLHLKMVKEEILTRLVRKKYIIEMKEKQLDEQNCSLLELRELELYLSNSHSSPVSNLTTSTVQKIVENRANMNKEDLEKEKNSTNRLQSILMSSNILPKLENSNNKHVKENPIMLPKHFSTSYLKCEDQMALNHQCLENGIKSNIGRQGVFKDVKSIIADFRQKNPETVPRVGKRVKIHDHLTSMNDLIKSNFVSQSVDKNLTLEAAVNYTPTLEKLLSTSTQNNETLNNKHRTSYSPCFKLRNDKQNILAKVPNLRNDITNEVSITPVSNNSRYSQNRQDFKGELLRAAMQTSIQQGEIYSNTAERRFKDLIGDNSFVKNEVTFCQECKIHEARFVCAGCGNQWYCSRNCQLSAWDKHSEVCIE